MLATQDKLVEADLKIERAEQEMAAQSLAHTARLQKLNDTLATLNHCRDEHRNQISAL